MKIENVVYQDQDHKHDVWLKTVSAVLAERLGPYSYPLRFAIVEVAEGNVVIEATIVHFHPGTKYDGCLSVIEIFDPRHKLHQTLPFGVAQIVPTGLRCEIGGYAGDACPATNLLAASADFVVTHPNAVNASELNEMAANVLYVEGKSLDDFLLGHLGLMPGVSNRIGTFVDRTGLGYIDDVVNTLNAASAVGGIHCDLYTILTEELGVSIEWSSAGCAVGTISHPQAIIEAVETLLSHGVDAVGGVSVIHGVTPDMFSKHLQGELPNPSGGVEAIITHLISKLFKVPTAHAPLPYYQSMRERQTRNPRAAAEFISTPHYFCVLKGLAKAPRLIPISDLVNISSNLITLNNIGAIVTPAGCLGGIPALVAEFSNIPLIAVRENAAILHVNNEQMKMSNVIEVNSYPEAAGVVLALRNGIALKSVRRPIDGSRRVDGPAKSGLAERISSGSGRNCESA